MNKDYIISETEKMVFQQLKEEGSGHDWWHIYRVTQTAKTIAEQEKADLFTCIMAALLHDLADEKIVGDEKKGIEEIKRWLTEMNVDDLSQSNIINIITTMSFKGGGRPRMETLEGKIVQDADRLDAIGAIGIARVFAYSGAVNQLIYDPNVKVRDDLTPEKYRQEKSTAINHFYEKLLKLKDLMNTDYGKKLAERKHQFMEEYLERFFQEWEGK
ncbi:HD domain-containing protein [Bacillus niameyensis]|uniref:HD domain-containing protein n=1 Tax=Bacillus niameyensis TaxID=1522308 RepID=UPI000781FE97|nr:HD domain-containing protein [Bacillus niameyensis]